MKPELRDLLIEHIDGPRLYRISEQPKGNRIRGAVTTGLLRFDHLQHPKTTMLTERGREALCKALAHWADALVRAAQRGIDLRYPEDLTDLPP